MTDDSTTRKRYAFRSVLGLALVVGAFVFATPTATHGQDLTTLLAKFLRSLSAGTMDVGGTSDALLVRDGAGVIAQRNGTNAQKFRIYKTFTDASNFQSLDIDTSTGGMVNITTNWAGTGTAWDLRLENAMQFNGNTGVVTNFGGSGADKATVGTGLTAIRANGRATAQTAANASVSTYTVGAADGSFEVSANVLVTTATTHTFTVECAYTDEGNTARTVTFSFEQLAGTLTTSITNTNGAVPYEGVPMHIRAKAATAILIRTQAAGVYTAVVYNVEGVIKQTA